MRLRIISVISVAFLCLASPASFGDLAPYNQDFEGLLLSGPVTDPGQVALADDGWLVFVNVFGPDWAYWYGYGPFPAPNGGWGGPAFSAVIGGVGGPAQGDQQLDVYSDYNNGNHGDGSNGIIETNVFREQIVGAADVGSTWRFEFDAKRGSIAPGSFAKAFFKTILLAPPYPQTNFIPIDMTNIPDAWGRYSLSIYIDPSLEGQALQFGFLNQASNYAGSGIFYDNVDFYRAPLRGSLDIKPGGCPNPINTRSMGVVPAALLGTAEIDVNDVDVSSLRLEGLAPIRWDYEDVAEPFAGDLCGCTSVGPDGALDLTLKFDTQELIDAIGASQSGDCLLTLTGTLLDGTPIEAQDCAVIFRRGAPSTVQGLQSFQDSTDGLQTVNPPSSTPGPREGTVRKPTSRRTRGDKL